MEKCDNANFLHGQWLASPPPGEEVVVSGIAGQFPNSHNVGDYWENLETKTDMVDDDDRRWSLKHPEVPPRTGKVCEINRLDSGFFGMHYKLASSTDPGLRVLLEKAVEALLDAGVNPRELEGTKTAVYSSVSWSDMINDMENKISTHCSALTGIIRCFFAQRISYFLKLKGSSVNVDTACSSSSNAIDAAFRAIRKGECENAIVATANLVLNPGSTVQFFRLGVLSPEGICKVFDQDANGYVRSETISVIFLQKAKNARRIYARIVNTKVNGDGFKDSGITFPSTAAQKQLMSEIYAESGINPSQITFVEAHGTGTTVGDPQEVEAIDLALAKQRAEPLLVGSVKSSIGHTEPASGICSLIKIILAMETDRITPNINLKKVKNSLTGFLENRMIPVKEFANFEDENAIFGLNNFGFGGNNAHIILQRMSKKKEPELGRKNQLPELVWVSGRTKESVETLLNNVSKKHANTDYIALLRQIYKFNIKAHNYRGYALFMDEKQLNRISKIIKTPPSLYLFFSDFDMGASNLGRELLNIEIFKTTIFRIEKVSNLRIFEALARNTLNIDKITSFAVQLGLLALFQELDIEIEAVYGDGLGKLIAGYYYNLVTLEEAIAKALESARIKTPKELDSIFDLITDLRFPLEKKCMKQIAETGRERDLAKIAKKTIAINVSDTPLSANDVKITDLQSFLIVLGNLYNQGFNISYEKLYKKFEYPVSRGTPTISPLIKWDHKTAWRTFKFTSFSAKFAEHSQVTLSYFDDEFKFIAGHVIDGRNLVPATLYLYHVWYEFCNLFCKQVSNCPVVIENCKFVRAALMSPNGITSYYVSLQETTGSFEILQNQILLVKGNIRFLNKTVSSNKTKERVYNSENMLQQDEIYKELYLRGYNYTGVFKGLSQCNIDATYGLVRWEDNWSAFMDKMLQIKILQADTRLLFVPVAIKRIVIDPIEHLKAVANLKMQSNDKELLMPVYADLETNVIRSGGITISGLEVKSIARKRQPLKPVLEKNEFVPNKGKMALAEIMRVNTQIILENSLESNFKAVELLEADDIEPSSEYLLPIINNVLSDIPVVNPLLTISSKANHVDIPGIKIEPVNINVGNNFLLIAGTHLLHKSDYQALLDSLCDNGYLITREPSDFELGDRWSEVELFTEYRTEKEKILLLKKRQKKTSSSEYIQINEEYDWISRLQNVLTKTNNGVVLYAYNIKPNGVLGLVNCLRREPQGNRIKCFFFMDEILDFELKAQNTEMAVNVFKNNQRGTYRHLLLDCKNEVETKHCLVNNSTMGDLSSLEWFEGPLTLETHIPKDQTLIFVYCASLNFKDIMAASARVGPEIFTTDRLAQNFLLGFEYSGTDMQGRKIGGLIPPPALSTMLIGNKHSMWYFDDSWSFEQICSIPVVYATVIYSLFMIAKMKPKTSILIHSGAGGVGLSAINVCQHFDCDIFVTVGTQEKRHYIRENYPSIKDSHIGNSRDTSFEKMIKRETKGRGVQIVLNSLTDEKLQASLRCLAPGGHFLEIGKFELANNTALKLLCAEKGLNYHGIMLDQVIYAQKETSKVLQVLVQEGIDIGYIKPLPTIAFKRDEIEKAFRYMTTGTHIGKVIVKIREENENKAHAANQIFKATSRYNCHAEKSYIIIGGLGGIGLELADWLVTRGARKLVLSSRAGVQTGYQMQRIGLWTSYGATITVETSDVTTEEGCADLLTKARHLGPVDAIFNLAAVLRDSLFEDQTIEMFEISLAAKAQTTKHLDNITRKLYQDLRHFVVFSSVSCGRGNAGQSNYGMANSIMERICERRKSDGFPGLAIQWGAVGDVGLAARMQKENKELVIGGTLQQKISSCLEVLDTFLNQDSPIVSSMLVAVKNNRNLESLSAVDTVARILGIKDIKTVSQHSTLAELGMDSMMGTELLQVLEKDFDIFITTTEMKSLTLAKLAELEAKESKTDDKLTNKAKEATNFFIQFIPHNTASPTTPLLKKMQSAIPNEQTAPILIIFPGIEGVLNLLENFAKNVNAHVVGVEYSDPDCNCSIQTLANRIFENLQRYLEANNNITIFAHSYGVLVATEVVHLLEINNNKVKFIAAEGSINYLVSAMNIHLGVEKSELQTQLLIYFLKEFISTELLDEYKEKIIKCKTFEERLDVSFALVPSHVVQKLDKRDVIVIYQRLQCMLTYTFPHKKLKSNVHLVKAKQPMLNFEDDYGLLEICEELSSITAVEGNHSSLVDHAELQNLVNKIIR